MIVWNKRMQDAKTLAVQASAQSIAAAQNEGYARAILDVLAIIATMPPDADAAWLHERITAPGGWSMKQ